jgi:valyl-tRNA synthetase
MEMEKTYQAQQVEEKWHKYWVENKTFSSKPDNTKKPFTIVIPPPNVTGSLHMGHALNDTLQDIIIRFKKLEGYNALWVPGTDHGGIATQNVVEKLLKKEGLTKYDLGRDKFIERMWQWRKESGDTILEQLKRLGCALDWDRTRFTMDEECSAAVKKAFITLYGKGLIYRGKRLVNWCTRCATAISDIEVEYTPEKTSLWHIKYPVKNSDKYVVVATTRPETMLGDTAVAVNPNDERYKNFIGKTIILPLTNREIKIVADFAVDQTFGTGAVKVTPAHDATDSEIGERNNLQVIDVIDLSGKINKEFGAYAGLSVKEAREKVAADLDAQGFLIKTEDYNHSVGKCYRCGTTVEPLRSEQWFLNVGEMSKKAAAADVKFTPSSWKKPYTNWLENLKDWCISRQIWWGHRIPIYYCVNENGYKNEHCQPIAAYETPTDCPCCKGNTFVQDEDVLDTWFSSALWPFSVLKWGTQPHNEDLKYYYPTNVLVTGHEILYLWVARMVQMGLEFQNDVPFYDVFIHGIVRDKSGKKMSKSLGNVVDPLGVMAEYGTDALRFALAQNAAPGRDMQISNESFLSARNFANKIWNASRFIIINAQGVEIPPEPKTAELADEWILAEFAKTAKKVSNNYNTYNMDAAARELYDFFWTKFCDWYIELSKIRMTSADVKIKTQVLSVLMYVLKECLKLMSPIMPYIAEEIWGIINPNIGLVCQSEFDFSKAKLDETALTKMNPLMEIITKIRTIRSEMNISPAARINVAFNVLDESKKSILSDNAGYVKTLAKIENLEIGTGAVRPKGSASAVTSSFEVFIPLEGLIDLSKERARLEKEITLCKQEAERANTKLANKNFTERAPKEEIEKIKTKAADAALKIEKLNESLKYLG